MKRSRISIFLGKKIVGALITIFLVMSILFVLLHSVPGGDIATRLNPFGSAREKALVRQQWGLYKPLYEQYAIYMKRVFTADYTVFRDQEVDAMDILLMFLPYTLLLFGTATIVSYLVGTYLGMRLLSKKGRWKTFISGTSIILYAVPAFVLAVYARTWLVFKYHIFPSVDIQIAPAWSMLVNLESPTLDQLGNMDVVLSGMILPLIVLVMVGLARPLFLMKDQMSVIVDEPFVVAARAKGLTEDRIFSRHVARCALLPLLSDASVNLALIFSGGILVEYIFNWPGIGQIFFKSLKVMHYPTITAAIFLLTVMLLISMFIMDMLYAYLDPRVSL
jgi:peptide/nickel transport system permease protein